MSRSEDGPRSESGFHRAVYVISIAAELSGMHPQTLRIYERKGLVTPARTSGGSRRYSDADIRRLNRIHELTNEGLNLEGAKRILLLEAENQRLRDELERLESAAKAEIEQTHRHYRRDLVPVKSEVELHRDRRSRRR